MLVNSASYRVNLDAMAACLEAGCHYLDLGGLYWMTGRQLELGPRFERAGPAGPARHRLGAGQDQPDGAARGPRAGCGARSSAIHVSAAGRDLDPPPGFSVPYALQTLLDELTMRPVVLRDGEPDEIEPLSDGGEVDFGDADRRGRDDLHPALRAAHVRRQLRLPRGSFRLSLVAGAAVDAARADGAPRRRRSRRRRPRRCRPRRKTVSVHLVEAAGGGRDGARSRGHRAERGVGPRRRRRLDRRARGGRGAAARPGRDRRPRRPAPRALHRARRRCSPSSSGGAAGSSSRPGRRCGHEGRRSHRDQGRTSTGSR